ncbi:MAG: CotH kinase family protein, partial [Candidatus Erginobacter occultus]|nr:CotH kinase family protein [Candidatus Erginobacter occultus]
YVNEPLRKTGRVDLRFEHYPRDVFSPVKYRAFQGERAGVKFRGNTNFWQVNRTDEHDWTLRKIPFSVRCEEPHRILNDSNTHHFYLGGGYSDISFLRNKLSYDLFKAMGEVGGEPRPAPDIDWAEVFVNGRYRGLYELGTRVDRHLLGWDRYDPEETEPALLYKFLQLGEECSVAYSVKYPPQFYGLHCEPYEELMDFLRGASAQEFGDRIERIVNLDSAIDWQLLVNYTDNRDGISTNMYLARGVGADSRFYFIPWDYDGTFRGRQSSPWLSNALTDRLWRDHPDYQNALAARWRQLRPGPLSEASVTARIDGMNRRLSGYAEWDSSVWGDRYARGITREEAWAGLRREALERLSWLDEFLGRYSDGLWEGGQTVPRRESR